MSAAINEQKLLGRTAHGARGWLWIALPAVLLGYLACAQLFSIALRFHDPGLVVIVGALAGVPTLFVLALGFRQGIAYARSFLPTLRWWHWLWALTIVSAMVFRRRTAADITSDPLDAWAVFRVAVDMIVAFVLLGRLALRRTHWVGSMFRGVVGALQRVWLGLPGFHGMVGISIMDVIQILGVSG